MSSIPSSHRRSQSKIHSFHSLPSTPFSTLSHRSPGLPTIASLKSEPTLIVLVSTLTRAFACYAVKSWGIENVGTTLVLSGGMGICGLVGLLKARRKGLDDILSPLFGLYIILFAFHQYSFYWALSVLPVIRVLIFTLLPSIWAVSYTFGKSALIGTVTLAITFVASILMSISVNSSFLSSLFAHLSIVLYISTGNLKEVLEDKLLMSIKNGGGIKGEIKDEVGRIRSWAMCVAAIIFGFESLLNSSSLPTTWPALQKMAYALVVIQPLLSPPSILNLNKAANASLPKAGTAFLLMIKVAAAVGWLFHGVRGSWSEVGLGVGVWLAIYLTPYQLLPMPQTFSPLNHTSLSSSSSLSSTTSSTTSPTYRLAKTYLKVILDNPESRRIWWFLLLNLGYMLVQMIWGVWTNSLGLISDAIHMFFDCMALGVGLFASVMASWKPNGEFTYGYGRVETLSGFANGIFLILISIFIVFEAIQRIAEPPEMNTSRLLLVSSIGLAINLFGMFATGGHAHHGHSHGGGHSHGPTPKPKAAPPPPPTMNAHAHSHSHAAPVDQHVDHNGHSHGHEVSAHDHQDHHDDHHGHSHSAPSAPSPVSHNGHSHSAGCDHDDHDNDDGDYASNDQGHSHNMRGVFLHVLADTMGSVGVIISTLLIGYTGWTGWDPIASLFIAALIVASVVPLVIDSGKVLCLDAGSENEKDIRLALSELASVEGLAGYGAPRFWPKDESTMVGSIHIHLAQTLDTDPGRPTDAASVRHLQPNAVKYANVDRVVRRVKTILKKRIRGLTELNVQVEGSMLGPSPRRL
ncbi:zinc transporter 5 [Phaffia rhodozyma]|uniref:Zinc transporter 5 n=1 Tax=Phaffia rhodozyma TaxID=264483 RepID=A0A0F7SFP5_PHARH|nr:zinc transporter 5 [Phaffia rhodozyma]